MNNIFENAYFGKMYRTRDGRKAIFLRKDEDENTFDLETEESYNPVRADGTSLFTKVGYEDPCDIISEWQEEINEKQEEKICGNCIFLKGTFCKYFGEYREPSYEQKEHDCFESHENL